MKPTDFKLTPADAAILSKALQTAKTKSFHRRIQIVYLRSLGKRVHEVSELTNCSTKTVSTLTKLYIEKGVEGLTTETRGGRHRQYLTHEEEGAFLNEQLTASLTGEFVTISSLYQAYQERVGKQTTREGFYALLKRHGWRKVTPRPEHPKKADAKTILVSPICQIKLDFWCNSEKLDKGFGEGYPKKEARKVTVCSKYGRDYGHSLSPSSLF